MGPTVITVVTGIVTLDAAGNPILILVTYFLIPPVETELAGTSPGAP
jgi:hypothetical protein